MAFRNKLTTTISDTAPTTIAQGTASYETVTHSIFISNIHTTGITVDINVTDGTDIVALAKDKAIPVNDFLVITKPINLMAGDSITCQCSDPAAAQAIVSTYLTAAVTL